MERKRRYHLLGSVLGAALAVLACTVDSFAQDLFAAPLGYTISTAAGPTVITEGGPGTVQSLPPTAGIAKDSSGNIYIAAMDRHKIFKLTPGGILTTFAGNGQPGSSGDGGPATSAQLNSPQGVAVDSGGNVYIADTSNGRVRKVTAATGIISTIAGTGSFGVTGDGGPGSLAALGSPTSVAVDGSGNVYVADQSNRRIRKISSSGAVTTFAGAGVTGSVGSSGVSSGDGGQAYIATFNSTRSIALDSNGNLYVADNSRIRKITFSTGVITTVAGNGDSFDYGDDGPATEAGLNPPSSIAVDSSGNIYIGAFLLRKISAADGIITTIAGTGDYDFAGDGGPPENAAFRLIAGLAVISADDIYLSDSNNFRIRRIQSGVIQTVAGNGGLGGTDGPAATALFNNPYGLATDAAGNLYIADSGNNRIRKLSTTGTVTTIAGTGDFGSSGDGGPAIDATLSFPQGIAVDANGNIYVGSGGRIRKIGTDGTINTFAGNGFYGYGGDNGPATAAQFTNITGLAFDTDGNLYVSDASNYRIRRIVNGTITTYAGTGTSGQGGDGGLATSAQLGYVNSIAMDAANNLYLADNFGGRIRKINSGGTISAFGSQFGSYLATDAAGNVYVSTGAGVVRASSTGTFAAIAGNGFGGLYGDGGYALSGSLYSGAITVAPTGIVYVADVRGYHIRQLTPLASPSAAAIGATTTGVSFITTTFQNKFFSVIFDSAAPLAWTATVSTSSGGNWLSISPGSGTGNLHITVNANPAGLAPGLFSGSVTLTSAQAVNGSVILPVTLLVPSPFLQSTKDVVSVSAGVGSTAATQTFNVNNVSSGSLSFNDARTIVTPSGGNWFSVSPSSGSTPGTLTLTFATSGLAVGNYLGGVTVTSTSTSASIYVPVVLRIFLRPATIVLDRNSVYFNSPTVGVSPALQTVHIANGGDATLSWSAAASSTGNWLGVSPPSGTNAGILTVSASATGLATGTYLGTVTITASASNSPVSLPVVYRVGPTVTGPYIISTIAGSTQLTEGGSATSQVLPVLPSVAFDGSGNLYVAAPDRHKVFKIATNGTLTTFAGSGIPGSTGDGGLASSARLNTPRSVAVDSSGNVYIADTYNSKVRKVTAGTNIITTIAGRGSYGYTGDGGSATFARLSYPQSVAVDGNANVFIADSGNFRVRKIAANGVITTIVGTGVEAYGGDDGPGASAQISYVSSIATDGSGNVFINDTNNNRIRKWTSSTGNISTFAGTGSCCYSGDNGPATAANLTYPQAVGADSAGNVYISDVSRIRKVNTGGTITTIAGTGSFGFGGDNGPATSAVFRTVTGIVANAAGDIWLADSSNHRIRKITATSGQIQTVAGSGSPGFFGDNGPATSALFSTLSGIAVDPSGVIYVVDRENHRVRKIATNGTITTVAGTGSSGSFGDGGLATAAGLSYPSGLALDRAGNLYITETGSNRIRRVGTNGIISTVAGNGVCCGFSGDGGPATQAQLSGPQAIVVDVNGVIYIADTSNYRIRRVGLDGIINTVAGTGIPPGNSGDGGPGTSAQIGYVFNLALDSLGNLYIPDSFGSGIRRLSPDGTIDHLTSPVYGTNVAIDAADRLISGYPCNLNSSLTDGTFLSNLTNGACGLGGDGGPALSAPVMANSVATDPAGNIYFADSQNNLIRKLTPVGNGAAVISGLYTSDINLSVSQGSPTTSLNFSFYLVGNGTFDWFASTPSGGSWLHVNPTVGSGNGTPFVGVSVDATGLAVGQYNGSIFLSSPQSVNGGVTIPVTLTVFAQNNLTPTLTSISPAVIPAGSGDTVVTFNGTNFSTGSFARLYNGFSYFDLPTTFVNSNQLTAIVPASYLTVDASYSLSVITDPPGGGQTVSKTLTVGTVSAPVITGITPNSGVLGTSVNATINGTSLAGATSVVFSGTGLTGFIVAGGTSTSLPITINIAGNAAIGSRTVTVITPGGSSSPFTGFNVNNPSSPPTITSITPNAAVAGTTVGATISGSNFGGTTGVNFSGNGVTATFGTATSSSLFVSITIAPNARTGPRIVTVTNPAGFSPGFSSFVVTAGTSLPIISVNRNRLYFNSAAGSNPPDQDVAISNGGAGTLSWTATAFSNVPGWLSVITGSGTGSLIVSVAGSTLPAGTYVGTIAISADGSVNSPVIIPVTYRVGSPITGPYTISTIAGQNVITEGGSALTQPLPNLSGIARDSSGNLYVAARPLNKIFKITPGGILTTYAGTGEPGSGGDRGPATLAQLNYPEGLVMDPNGNLLITDTGGRRIRKVTPAGMITTIAGTGSSGFLGDGGPATSAQISFSTGIALDTAGNLYIADRDNQRIRKVATNGIISTIAGSNSVAGFAGDGGPATAARLSSPVGVAVDGAGNVYIADQGNNRVRKIDAATGNISTFAGNGSTSFGGDNGLPTSAGIGSPQAIVLDAAGNVYVTGNNRIRKISGNTITTFAGTGLSGFSGDGGPATSATFLDLWGLVFDGSGNLIFADQWNHRVRRIDTSGVITTLAGHGPSEPADFTPLQAQLLAPDGAATDALGNLYFSDTDKHRIIRIGTDGVTTVVAGTGVAGFSGDDGPASTAKVNRPRGIAVDAAGNIYFADFQNHRVRKIGTDGIIRTVAGTGAQGFSGDSGAATAAQLNFPFGVAIDANGVLYIADSSNHRIRMVNVYGNISTFAGTGTSGSFGDNGLATAAQLNVPRHVTVDNAGNVYVADSGNFKVRMVMAGSGVITTVGPSQNAVNSVVMEPDGSTLDVSSYNSLKRVPFGQSTLTTFAGSGSSSQFGDGGSALTASFVAPDFAIDPAGTIYITSNETHVIRKLTPQSSVLSLSPTTTRYFTYTGPTTTTLTSTITVNTEGGSFPWTATPTITTPAGGTWLSVNVSSGTGSGNLIISASRGSLGPGTYRGTVTVTAPQSANGSVVIPVVMIVTPLTLSVSPVTIQQTASVGIANPPPQTLAINSTGIPAGSFTFTASRTVVTPSGGNWFAISPTSGSSGGWISVSFNTAGLAAGSYTGLITINSTDSANTVVTVPVTLNMVTASPIITVSPQVIFLDSPNRGLVSRQLNISNGGSGSLNWTAVSGGENVFNLSAGSGTTPGSLTVSANTDSDGTYIGSIVITAAGAVNSPVTVPVALRVGDPISPPYSISTVGGPITLAEGSPAITQPLPKLTGLAMKDGNFYVASDSRSQIYKIDANGVFSVYAGTGKPGRGGDGGPAAFAQFFAPQNLTFDTAGNLYVADSGGGVTSRIRKIDAEGTITTVAGSDGSGFAGDGGPATQARLSSPRGVAFDAGGSMYIADTNNHRIRKVATDGTISTIAGTGVAGYNGDGIPATSAQLSSPWAVIVDGAGNIYIADRTNRRVRKISTNGTISTVAGNGSSVSGNGGDGGPATSAQITSPSYLALDSDGTLYISDQGNPRVRAVSTNGIISTFAGNGTTGLSGDGGAATAAMLRVPAGIFFDSTYVYINDGSNNRLRQVNKSTGVIQTIAGSGPPGYRGDGGPATQAQFQTPNSVVSDPEGNLYIADQANNRIRMIGVGGTVTTFVNTSGVASSTGDNGPAVTATVNAPQGVAMDTAGNLYIADTNGHRIRKVNAATGIITTIVGTGNAGFSGDGGLATNAQLNGPRSVAVDAIGNIYIADNNNARIRRVTPDGIIGTIAGNGIPFIVDGPPGTALITTGVYNLLPDYEGRLYFLDPVIGSPTSLRIIDLDGTIYTEDTGINSVTIDISGNAFYFDGFQVFRVTPPYDNDGVPIVGGTFAANSRISRLYGDNTPGLAAAVTLGTSITTDAFGNVYAADTTHHLIRKISPIPDGTTALTIGNVGPGTTQPNSNTSFDFSVCTAIPTQSLSILINIEGRGETTWFAEMSVRNGGTWLGLSATTGSGTSSTFTATADATGLPLGIYSGTVTISADGSMNETIDLPVSLLVSSTCNPSPTLTSVNPNVVNVTSQDQLITVKGNNFVLGSTAGIVSIAVGTTSALATTYVSSTELSAVVPAGFLTSPGSWFINVRTQSPGGGISNSLPFAVGTSFPIITSIDTASGGAGASVSANITGQHLSGAQAVLFNGTGLTATILAGGTDTVLPVTINISNNAPTGTQTFTVTTASGTSNTFTGFTVFASTPVINDLTATPAGLNQSLVPLYGGGMPVTVRGDKFISGAVVSIAGSGAPTTFVDTTQLTVQVPWTALTIPGSIGFRVSNPDLSLSNMVNMKVIERADLNATRTINIGDALVCALTVGGLNKPPLTKSVGDLNLDGNVTIGDCLVSALFSGRVNVNTVTPTITSATPNPATRGNTLTLDGTGIYGTPADIRVMFTTVDAAVRVTPLTVSNGSLTVTVPDIAVSGPIQIYRMDSGIGGGEYPLMVSNTVAALTLTSVSPAFSVARGSTITLNGLGFNPIPASNIVAFQSTSGISLGTVITASVNSLTVTVPNDALCGAVSVTADFVLSNRRAVMIAGTPCSVQLTDILGNGLPGENIVLEGTGFDVVTPANNIVRFAAEGGGTVVGTVLQAGGTQLQVHIPSNAVSGDVTVTVDGATSNALTYSTSISPLAIDVVINSPSDVGTYQVVIGYDNNVVLLLSADITGGTGAGFTGIPTTVISDTGLGSALISSTQTGNHPHGVFTVAHLVFTPRAPGTTIVSASGFITDTLGQNSANATLTLSRNTITVPPIP